MLSSRPREAIRYTTSRGDVPFDDWFTRLRDVVGKAKIASRVERAEQGNFGEYRELGAGLYELKERFGPGYRVYFSLDKDELIVLFGGGDKRSQSKDIKKARIYLDDYRRRKRNG